MLMENYIDQFESYADDLAVITLEEVQQFLNGLPQAWHDEMDFIAEICQISLELSWLRWPDRLCAFAEKISPDAVFGKFQDLPRARDFAALASRTPGGEWLASLYQSEFRLRAACGDYPSRHHFSRNAGIPIPSQRLPNPRRIVGDFRFAGLNMELHGYSLFGRKRSFDPDGQLLHEHPHGQRINVAPARELRVSREQFTVRVLSPEFAIVQNISRTNPLCIAGEKQALNLGEAKILRFPFVIILPNGSLRFA